MYSDKNTIYLWINLMTHVWRVLRERPTCKALCKHHGAYSHNYNVPGAGATRCKGSNSTPEAVRVAEAFLVDT